MAGSQAEGTTEGVQPAEQEVKEVEVGPKEKAGYVTHEVVGEEKQDEREDEKLKEVPEEGVVSESSERVSGSSQEGKEPDTVPTSTTEIAGGEEPAAMIASGGEPATITAHDTVPTSTTEIASGEEPAAMIESGGEPVATIASGGEPATITAHDTVPTENEEPAAMTMVEIGEEPVAMEVDSEEDTMHTPQVAPASVATITPQADTPDAMAGLPGSNLAAEDAYRALALRNASEGLEPMEEPEVSLDLTLTLGAMLKEVVAKRERQEIEALASKYTAVEVLGSLSEDAKCQSDVSKVLDQCAAEFRTFVKDQIGKSNTRKTYAINNLAWSASELKDVLQLSDTALRLCETKQPSGKAKHPDLKPATPEHATPPVEPSPARKKKEKPVKKDVQGMQNLLSKFVVVKKREEVAEELAAPCIFGGYIMKEGTRYSPYHKQAFEKVVRGKVTRAYVLPGEAVGKGRKIGLSVPSLEELVGGKVQVELEDVRERVADVYAKDSINMFHRLVSRGGAPLEIIAVKGGGQVQYVGSAPDPTKDMAAVWPIDEPMPRDTKEVDYDELSDAVSHVSSCSGSSLENSVEASECDGSSDGSFVEDESDDGSDFLLPKPALGDSTATEAIRVDGPCKHLTYAALQHFAPPSALQIPVCPAPTASYLRIPLQDYFYREVMKRYLGAVVVPPEGLSTESEIWEEGVELKRPSTNQRVVWDDDSLKELLKVIHCSFHAVPYLVDTFRERFPKFPKSSVVNKIKEVAAKDPTRANAMMARTTLLEQLDLTELLEQLPILEGVAAVKGRRKSGNDSPTTLKKKTTGKPAKKKKTSHPSSFFSPRLKAAESSPRSTLSSQPATSFPNTPK